MGNLKGCFTSNSDEWATPQELYDALDAEFNFNLDPCATDNNHKCAKYYTAQDDGLKKSWGGAECFATHHTAILQDGLRSVTERAQKITRWLCY